MFNYTKKELKGIFIVILILTIVFAFDDGAKTFVLESWLVNFMKVFLIIALGIFVHDFGHDLIARKQGFNSEFRVWGMRRLGLSGPNTYPKTFNILGRKVTMNVFPIGVILAILVTLFSNGKLYWAAVSSYGLVKIRAHRLGKKFIEVTDFEEAKIAIAGPMAMLFLLVLLKIFNGGGLFDKFIFIYSVIVIYDILPIPELDGYKVAMGSKPLFAFGFVFIVSTVLLAHFLGGVFALLLALLIALVIGVVYFYFMIFKM